MPAKSKRRKGRFPAQSQKRRPVTVAPATAVEQQQPAEAVQAPRPAPRPKSPAAAKQAAAAKPVEVIRRVAVSTEIRNIAIVAGVILAILITIGVILR